MPSLVGSEMCIRDSGKCDEKQCCETFCSYYDCPDKYTSVDYADTIACPYDGCTTDLCCDPGEPVVLLYRAFSQPMGCRNLSPGLHSLSCDYRLYLLQHKVIEISSKCVSAYRCKGRFRVNWKLLRFQAAFDLVYMDILSTTMQASRSLSLLQLCVPTCAKRHPRVDCPALPYLYLPNSPSTNVLTFPMASGEEVLRLREVLQGLLSDRERRRRQV